MPRFAGGLWQNLIAVQVYGANTGVGKTVVSTLLARHLINRSGKTRWRVSYIKPVSTGSADEADSPYVRKYAECNTTSLYQFSDPVSPHVAARSAPSIPDDAKLVAGLSKKLSEDAISLSMSQGKLGFSLVETAGGILSPGPSGTPQADLFRPLRLPVILVGDHRLGGISATISAFESLHVRGYDVDAVVVFDDGSKYENASYLKKYFEEKHGTSTFSPSWIPNVESLDSEEEGARMLNYYQREGQSSVAYALASHVISKHVDRLKSLDNAASKTSKAIWHPFTQHQTIKTAKEVLVFDSAYGDYFQVRHTSRSQPKSDYITNKPLLYPAFDGSASWWTQGLGHGNPSLSLSAAYAAGRYGHIMFAGATHEPALTLAQSLLKGLDNSRLAKVFYSDDGSTAVEVGIKMALRAACKRYQWDGSQEEVGVIGLKGSYHGDTIGAMDLSEPSVYNKKVDWYRGRGHWFDYPRVYLKKGMWIVEPPQGKEEDFGPVQKFGSLEEIFDIDNRGHSPRYEKYIRSVLDRLIKDEGRKFGALIMEPIIMGAGGMLFVDPLFQRTLINTVRSYAFGAESLPVMNTLSSVSPSANPEGPEWQGLPVIFDEVFTGLYRLGRFSAASFLSPSTASGPNLLPDISIHAKLLTGGLLPLSVTLASQSIFNAFLSDDKSDALLHGHSYTAHPIGCHVANTSLKLLSEHSTSIDWLHYRRSWLTGNQIGHKGGTWTMGRRSSGSPSLSTKSGSGPEGAPAQADNLLWSFWSKSAVYDLSQHPLVDHVICLGSVLAVSLLDKSGSGYTSNAAVGLRDDLLYNNVLPVENAGSNVQRKANFGIHSRVLGNVLYLMASMTSRPKDLMLVERALLRRLDLMRTAG